MQFFPIDSAITEAANLIQAGASSVAENADEFGTVLSSFIEENREDYTGRPVGFSAYGPSSGTLSNDDANTLAEQLRLRDVSEYAIDKLNMLAMSGAPVTIGSAYNAISGISRSTESLNDAEGTNFKMLMSKLGFSTTEQDELLSMSDSGDVKSVLQRLTDKLESLDTLDMSKQEWSSLLKGLDVSAENKKGLMTIFAGAGSESKYLSGKELKQLLSTVRAEQETREAAMDFAKTQLRDAVAATLQTAKFNERSGQVNDTRGNKFVENSESLMQQTVRGKIGMDDIAGGKSSPNDEIAGGKSSQHGEPAGGKSSLGGELAGGKSLPNGEFGGRESAPDGEPGEEAGFGEHKNRAEAVLADSGKNTKNFEAVIGEKSKEVKGDTRLSNVVSAPSASPSDAFGTPQAQNLNTTSTSARQEIFSQVEQGILRGAQNGSQNLTLHLNQGELGQVTVALTMHQGELKATIRTDNQDAASALQEQMTELKASLEAEGIKVKDLDVQMSAKDESGAPWDGQQGHNMLRDAEERTRALRLSQLRREAGESGTKGQNEGRDRTNEHAGLHLVA